MAGSYADVPNYRLPYDRWSSLLFYHGDGSPNLTIYDPRYVHAINNEGDDTVIAPGDGAYFSGHVTGLIFPQPVNVTGYFINHEGTEGGWFGAGNFTSNIYISSNTTNGIDGTWTIPASSWAKSNGSSAPWRTSITTTGYGLPWNNIKSVKFLRFVNGGGNRWKVIHLYGTVATQEYSQRLMIVDPISLNEVPAAYFDFGDSSKMTGTLYKTFRVKNVGTTTIDNINVTTEALTDTTPGLVPDFTYSYNGVDFYKSLNIPVSLAPGQNTTIITLKFTIPSDASLTYNYTQRIVVTPGSLY